MNFSRLDILSAEVPDMGKANPFPGDKRFCAAWLAEIHRQEGRRV